MSKTNHPNKLSQSHNRQCIWQIYLPIIIAAVAIIIFFIALALESQGINANIKQAAGISLIWCSLPFLLGGLIILAILIGLIWLTIVAGKKIPVLSLKIQTFFFESAIVIHTAADKTVQPILKIGEISGAVQAVKRKLHKNNHQTQRSHE